LYTISFNGYWEKHSKTWVSCVNRLNTAPDEIVIVSDKKIDTSALKSNNVKNIVVSVPTEEWDKSYYRNIAVDSCTSDWVVSYDLDDEALPNYLDNLDINADIHAFSFSDGNYLHYPDSNALLNRLHNIPKNAIPGTSAIKKGLFKRLKYENYCHEDLVLYSMSNFFETRLSFDRSIRFKYSGFHNGNNEKIDSVSKIYQDMLLGKNRKIYFIDFSKTKNKEKKILLKTLTSFSNLKIEIVSSNNFYEYENKEIPIHKNFAFWGDKEKEEYAVAYLMYFYGGAFALEGKKMFDWNKHFDLLLKTRHDGLVFEESQPNNSLFIDKDNFNFSINKNFVFKPRTSSAYLWLDSLSPKT
jgi:hypothetical protein